MLLRFLFFICFTIYSASLFSVQIEVKSKREFDKAMYTIDNNFKRLYGHPSNFTQPDLELCEHAFQWARLFGSKEDITSSQIYLVQFYTFFLKMPEAIQIANQLLSDPEIYKNKDVLVVLWNLHISYSNIGKIDRAIAVIKQFDKYDKIFKNSFKIPPNLYYEKLGFYYYKLHNYQLAKINYFKSLTLSSYAKAIEKSSTANNVGLCFKNLDNKDSAMYYYNLALEILDKDPGKKERDLNFEKYIQNFEAVIRSNIAFYLVKEKKYDEALDLFQKEMLADIETHNYEGQLGAYLDISKLYFAKKEWINAYNYASDGLDLFVAYQHQTGLSDYKLDLLQFKEKSLLQMGKFKEADQVFNESLKWKRELQIKENETNKKLEDLWDESIKVNKLLLINRKDLEEKENTKKGLIIITLVISTAFFVSFYFYKKSRKTQEIIAEQAKNIEKELLEKKHLLKEIHHRVKNNMQVISSLLEINTAGYDNEIYEEINQDLQGYIKTMTLVHEMLYRNGDFSEVEMEVFIPELIDKISSTFVDAKLNISYDLEDVKLKIEKSVPLGLLLNEVFFNTYKYAYTDKVGEVHISLKRKGQHIVFVYEDFGCGLPPTVDFYQADSVGLTLIRFFAEEMDAVITLDPSKGTRYVLEFKKVR